MITQIYEVQTIEEARKLIELNVDVIGTVVREDDYKDYKKLVDFVMQNGRISSVIPLTKNTQKIIEISKFLKPTIIHLTPEFATSLDDYLSELKKIRNELGDQKIMHVIPVPRKNSKTKIDSVQIMKKLEPSVDRFIIDTFIDDEPESGFVGITGKTCDWDIARKIVEETDKPVILAGGLNPDNVREGIEYVKPFGVDSCTGTNLQDEHGDNIRFKKDLEKVRKFVENAKKLNPF